MATIAKLTNGKFKAIIRDAHGRYLQSKTFVRRADARTWGRRIESERAAALAAGETTQLTPFSALARRYLGDYDGRAAGRPGQVKWWAAHFGDRPITTIRADDIRHALDTFAEGCALRWDGVAPGGRPKFAQTGRTRSPATVNRQRAALSSLIRYAMDKGLLHRNPVQSVRTRPENNKRTRYLDDAERTALLTACRTSHWDRLYLLVLMALMTGARQGELLALRWLDIDFNARTARLHQTKNGEPRIITLPVAVIEEMLRFRGTAGLIFPRENCPERPYTFRKAWNTALKEAGIINFRFHDLRHSAASYLAMGGASVLEIAEVLGHKDLKTTQRYTHLSVTHRQELTDRLLGGLAGPQSGSAP